MPRLAAEIQTTASLIPHLLTVLSKLHHMDTMMKTMITKVTTVNSAIQILKTAVDLTDVIPLEEDTE